MAALDGKITIGVDYRPCIVHIPAVTRNRRQDLNVYREVVKPEKDITALFHCWSHRSEAGIMGQVSSTFAIVEFKDGTVHEVEPWNIRFIDKRMEEYDFTKNRNEKGK